MTDDHRIDDASHVDLTGRTLGDYRLVRRLGRGGMSDVYLADQISLDRHIALKVLKAEMSRDQKYVHRLHQEARAAAALVQSNIVQIYEVGEVDGIHFIAQEYVRGQNLGQFIARHGAVEPIMAANVIRQVGMALQKATEHGVVHRDIKPENIMLTPGGEVKVADFGLARITDDAKRNALTQIGITMGTPLYMSPEQVEGKPVDCRSDMYSLGVTAYHMLAGQPPYGGENALAVALQHVKHDPTPLSEIRPDAPQQLCALVHKLLAKQPDARFQTPTDLLKELRRIPIEYEDWDELVEQLAVADTVAEAQPTVIESKLAITQQLESIMQGNEGSWWSRRSTWIAFLTLTAIGLVAGAMWSLQNPPSDPLTVDESKIRPVPRRGTVEEQYRYGYRINSEAAWNAVTDYFPVNGAVSTDGASGDRNQRLMYSRMADARLGELYLKNNRLQQALVVYERLSKVEEMAQKFRVIGFAGLAIVHDRMNERDRAAEYLELVEANRELLNIDMQEMIDEMLQRYGRPQPEVTFHRQNDSLAAVNTVRAPSK